MALKHLAPAGSESIENIALIESLSGYKAFDVSSSHVDPTSSSPKGHLTNPKIPIFPDISGYGKDSKVCEEDQEQNISDSELPSKETTNQASTSEETGTKVYDKKQPLRRSTRERKSPDRYKP